MRAAPDHCRRRLSSFRRVALTALMSAVIARAADPAPRVALINFAVADVNSSRARIAAAELSAIVQATVSAEAGYVWVERQELDRAFNEFELAGRGVINTAAALRMGHQLQADLLVLGTLRYAGLAGPQLEVEVIDLPHADVVASQVVDLPPHPNGRFRLEPTDRDGGALAVRTVLAQAAARIQAMRRQPTIAPLYFKNVGGSDRLNFFEAVLQKSLRDAGRDAGDMRVLQFERTRPATEERELALMGITEYDRDAWHRVADYYVWGTFKESPRDATAWDAQPVEVVVTAWDGESAPRELRWEGKVNELESGARALARDVLALARAPRATAADGDGERHRAAMTLHARATEIQKRFQQEQLRLSFNDDQDEFLRSPTGARLYAYRVRLLETACFFDPADKTLQQERLDAKWALNNPVFPEVKNSRGRYRQLSTSDRWQRYVEYHGFYEKFSSLPDGTRDPESYRRRIDSLEELVNAFRAQGELTHARDIAAAAEIWLREVLDCNTWAANRQPPAWIQDYNRERLLFGFERRQFASAGVKAVLPMFEKLWPYFRRPFLQWREEHLRGSPEDADSVNHLASYVFLLHRTLGQSKQAVAILTEPFQLAPVSAAPAAPALAPVAPPPPAPVTTSRPAAPMSASSAEVLARLRAMPGANAGPPGATGSTALNVGALPPELQAILGTASAFGPEIEPAFDDVGIWPGTTPPGQRPRDAFHALHFDGARLWISASSDRAKTSSGNALIVYEPASRSTASLTALLGEHSPVRRLQVGPAGIWLGTDYDGLWKLGPAPHAVHKVTPEEGLPSPKIGALALTDSGVLVAGLGPKGFFGRVDAANNQWTDLLPPAPPSPLAVQQIGTDLIKPPGMAAFQNWALIQQTTLRLFNGNTKAWTDVYSSPAARQQIEAMVQRSDGVNRPGSLRGDDYPVITSDEHGFWLGATRGLRFFDPRQDADCSGWFPSPPIVAMAHQGHFLWVALDLFGSGMDQRHLFLGANAVQGTRLAVFDKTTGTWRGSFLMKHVNVTALAASAQSLWIGADRLIEIDTRQFNLAVAPPPPAADYAAIWAGLPAVTETARAALAARSPPKPPSAPAASSAAVAVISRDAATKVAPAAAAVGRPSMPSVANGEANKAVVKAEPRKLEILPSTDWPYFSAPVFPVAPPRPPEQVAQDAALLAAAEHGDIGAARRALAAGAWIDAPDKHDWTPLVHALRAKAFPLARLLVDEGATLDLVTRAFETPVPNSPGYVVEEAEKAPITFAVEAGDVDTVAYLLEQGADPNLAARGGQFGSTALAAAARSSTEMTRLLLEHGAEPNQLARDVGHYRLVSPLMFAAGRGNVARVNLLLEHGAKLDTADRYFISGTPGLQQELTVYMFAAASNNVPLLRQLEQQGENPRFVEPRGDNALSWAADNNASAAVDYLLALGIKGDRAVARAEERGHLEIVEKLRRAGLK